MSVSLDFVEDVAEIQEDDLTGVSVSNDIHEDECHWVVTQLAMCNIHIKEELLENSEFLPSFARILNEVCCFE